MKEQARGIVLRTHKHGESDLICRLLTNRGAKLSLIAKGALRSKKRFAGGVLEATHLIEAIYRSSKKSDNSLGFLGEARLLEDFSGIRSDYDRIQLALYILKCTEGVSQEGYEAPTLYDLVGNSLKALAEGKSLTELRVHFQIKLLYIQGVLNPEEWQKPFLKASILERLNIETNSQQRYSVENMMQTYLATAEGEFTFFNESN